MDMGDCLVSVIAPVYNDASIIEAFIGETVEVLQAHYSNYELVLVDDHSTDELADKVAIALQRYDGVRLLRLSKKFGAEIAISAGLDSAIGDFVVVAMPDLDPPQEIPKMIELARSGYHLVTGICENKSKGKLLVRLFTPLFYTLCNRFLDFELHKNSTNFRVLSRQAVNAIVRIKDKSRYLRVLSTSIGYPATTHSYRQICRSGKPKIKGIFEAWGEGMSVIVNNSIRPLRFVSYVGVFASMLNLLYVLYIIVVHLVKNQVAEGWTTLSLQATGMFFGIFVILVVLCEYVGRILEESKDRPLYHVMGEKNSSVLLDQDRLNVSQE